MSVQFREGATLARLADQLHYRLQSIHNGRIKKDGSSVTRITKEPAWIADQEPVSPRTDSVTGQRVRGSEAADGWPPCLPSWDPVSPLRKHGRIIWRVGNNGGDAKLMSDVDVDRIEGAGSCESIAIEIITIICGSALVVTGPCSGRARTGRASCTRVVSTARMNLTNRSTIDCQPVFDMLTALGSMPFFQRVRIPDFLYSIPQPHPNPNANPIPRNPCNRHSRQGRFILLNKSRNKYSVTLFCGLRLTKRGLLIISRHYRAIPATWSCHIYITTPAANDTPEVKNIHCCLLDTFLDFIEPTLKIPALHALDPPYPKILNILWHTW